MSLILLISGFFIVDKIILKLLTAASLISSFVSLILLVSLGTIKGKFSESYYVPQ